ncbi:MAG TPA: hypothetical protein VEF89_13815 [Solirubrobacteraceae bacterium]|nr:hypothetical protein [Solirubrobacteraceae bacterium]
MSSANGEARELGELSPATPSSDARDAHAAAVLDARLGREARDVLEAAVVLEAWTGRPARGAMTAARRLVKLDGPSPHAIGDLDPFDDASHHSVLAEGVALVLLILSVAAWATPIRRQLGPTVLSTAIRVSLPIAVALQWGLRSRYLSRPEGLECLARDGVSVLVWCLLLFDLPLLFMRPWGPVAAMLVPVWVGGTVITMRGWGLLYAGVLVVGTIAMEVAVDAYVVLGSLAGITLLLCAAAVGSVTARTDLRAGSMRRAALAGLIGGLIGALLVSDPSLGWGVHGLHPSIALLPSAIGSFWGGYYLWNFYDAVPRGLRGVPLRGASRIALSDPAMSIFLGGIARLLGATFVLSAIVVALGHWTHGTDEWSVFVAFGLVGLLTLLVGLLEAFALHRAALIATALALATELLLRGSVHIHVSGGALVAGAAVGVMLALPVLLVRLARSGGVLATTLWIQ